MPRVQLVSSDNMSFEVEYDRVIKSHTIKNFLEDSDDFAPIPLPNVKSRELAKIVDYFNDAPLPSMEREELFEMTIATNYLNIPCLLDALCKRIAQMLSGKSVEEMRIFLNVENDFSPEEEEAISKEQFWAFE